MLTTDEARRTMASTEYAKLKVAELKELLKERGLAVTGKKAELVARLEEADVGADVADGDVDVDVDVEEVAVTVVANLTDVAVVVVVVVVTVSVVVVVTVPVPVNLG